MIIVKKRRRKGGNTQGERGRMDRKCKKEKEIVKKEVR